MLNDRQKRLYEFLLDKASTNVFISKHEIYTNLSELYPTNNGKANNVHYASRLIESDVQAINSSDFKKIVVSSAKGYKIANHDEAVKYLKRRFKRDFKSLRINWNLKNKISKNGQYQIEDEEIKEIKTFIEGKQNG